MQVFVLEQWADQYEFIEVAGVFASLQEAEARASADPYSDDYLWFVSQSELGSGVVQESVRLFR